MTYAALRQQDYKRYLKNTWWWQRYNPRRFNDVHRACIEVLAADPNPSRAIRKTQDALLYQSLRPNTAGVQTDWLNIVIDAVLEALGVPAGVQRDMLRAFIRLVLQILLSSLVFAEKSGEFGLSEGKFNAQVKAWATEASQSP